MNKNRVILAGNITDDVKVFNKCNKFSLAVNNFYNDSTLYVDVVAFGKLADVVKKLASKGRGVLVEGRLDIQRTKKDETWYTNVSVVAEDIQFERLAIGAKNSTPGTEPEPVSPESDDVPF